MPMPPRVLKKIISSCSLTSRPTSTGRRRLSTLPTRSPQKASSPIALTISPEKARMMTAGNQTRAEPTAGMMERKVMTVPQNTAPSIPTTQKARPARLPWITPITRVPLMAARVTEVNLSRSLSFIPSCSGMWSSMRRRMYRPSLRKKNMV